MSDNPLLDFTFTCVGLLLVLVDIVLDAWAIVSFYREEAYVYMWLLLLFLIGSSVIGQVYSWLFYGYHDDKPQSRVESCLSPVSLKTLHVFQMGVFLRYAGIMEVAVRKLFTKNRNLDVLAVFQKFNLSLLRLIENFTESAPQLVLVLTVMIQRGEVEPFTLLKAAGSALAIAGGVTSANYHRAKQRKKQTVCSWLVFFLWNLLLMAPRIVALSLFASVLPRVIFAHFLCSWMILVFAAWWLQTDLMYSVGGEWLWKATVGLIWYFRWFNMGGQARFWIVYHAWMMLDLVLLCGLWCWRIYCELPQPHYTFIVSSVIIAVYGIGVACKVMSYRKKKDPKCEAVKSLYFLVEQDTEMSMLERDTEIVSVVIQSFYRTIRWH